MALADDIRALRDRVLADLDAGHDYFVATIAAWRVVQEAVVAGKRFRVRNKATGNLVTESQLAGKARDYVNTQLTQATFQQFIAIFESFFFDLLRLWLVAFPRNLLGRKVDFKEVLEAPDKDAITLHVVNRELNEILYERPRDWFTYLEEQLKLGCPTPEEIDRIAEAKASRDVLAHNRGVVGKSYLAKAGKLARYATGERIDVPEPYHRQTWELLRKVVDDVATATAAKAP